MDPDRTTFPRAAFFNDPTSVGQEPAVPEKPDNLLSDSELKARVAARREEFRRGLTVAQEAAVPGEDANVLSDSERTFWVAELVDPLTGHGFGGLYWNGHTRPLFEGVTTRSIHEALQFKTRTAVEEVLPQLAVPQRGLWQPTEHQWVNFPRVPAREPEAEPEVVMLLQPELKVLDAASVAADGEREAGWEMLDVTQLGRLLQAEPQDLSPEEIEQLRRVCVRDLGFASEREYLAQLDGQNTGCEVVSRKLLGLLEETGPLSGTASGTYQALRERLVKVRDLGRKGILLADLVSRTTLGDHRNPEVNAQMEYLVAEVARLAGESRL
jgi:hypothetical protein